MHKIITKTLLLLTLLVLLIGITSAATVSENTTTKVEKDMNTSPQEEVQKSNEIVEKEIIKKETYKTSNTKEASTNIEVSDFNTLHNTLTKDTYDTVTVNLNLSIL